MIYEKIGFLQMETNLIKYGNHSFLGNTLINDWLKACKNIYNNSENNICYYLKYSDARKLLIGMLQNSFIYFKRQELNTTCELILQLLEFSERNEQQCSPEQKNAWFINKLLKKYDFIYWEVKLRELGEDETDIVRKIYNYLQKWENRIEAADTISEYLVNKITDKEEAEKAMKCIKILIESNTIPY